MTCKHTDTPEDEMMAIAEHLETISDFLFSVEAGTCDGCLNLARVARDNIKINLGSLYNCLNCLSQNITEKGSPHDLH